MEAPDPMYPKVCPKIREDLFNGVEAAAKSLRYNNSTSVPEFFASAVHLLMLPFLPLKIATSCVLSPLTMDHSLSNTLCVLLEVFMCIGGVSMKLCRVEEYQH